MEALAMPTAAPPVLYGAPAPPGQLLPWSWAEQRLVAARTYWIATTRPTGRPHCRPVWGVWLADGFWFSTGSLARHNLAANPQITLHLESGEAAGPAYRVRPRVVFGWDTDMRAPTRWSFPDPTISVTP
jgi:hypothetical protein